MGMDGSTSVSVPEKIVFDLRREVEVVKDLGVALPRDVQSSLSGLKSLIDEGSLAFSAQIRDVKSLLSEEIENLKREICSITDRSSNVSLSLGIDQGVGSLRELRGELDDLKHIVRETKEVVGSAQDFAGQAKDIADKARDLADEARDIAKDAARGGRKLDAIRKLACEAKDAADDARSLADYARESVDELRHSTQRMDSQNSFSSSIHGPIDSDRIVEIENTLHFIQNELKKLQVPSVPLDTSPGNFRELRQDINDLTNFVQDGRCLLGGLKDDVDVLREKIERTRDVADDAKGAVKEVRTLFFKLRLFLEQGEIPDISSLAVPQALFSDPGEDLEKELRCIKYEVKKLKGIRPISEGSALRLHAQVQSLHQEVFEAKSVATEAKSIASETRAVADHAKSVADEAQLASGLARDCFESGRSVAEAGRSALNDIQTCLSDLKQQAVECQAEVAELKGIVGESRAARQLVADVRRELETVKNLVGDSKDIGARVTADLRCIKYEIRRLKKGHPRPNSSSSEIVDPRAFASLRQEFVVLRDSSTQDIRCIKYEVRRLKRELQAKLASSSVEPFYVTSLRQDISTDLRCLKYELRKLKAQRLAHGFESENTGLRREIAKVRQMAQDAKDVAVEIHKGLKGGDLTEPVCHAEMSKMFRPVSHDINCLKYEVRRLKGVLAFQPLLESLRRDVNCLKYETRRLKSHAKDGREFGIGDKSLRRQFAALKETVTKLQRKGSSKTLSGSEVQLRGASGSEVNPQRLQKMKSDIKKIRHAVEDVRATADQALKRSKRSKSDKERDEILDQLVQQFGSLKAVGHVAVSEHILHDIKCLKYEVRQIKRHGFQGGPAPIAEFRNEIAQLRNEIAELRQNKVGSGVVGLDELRHDVKCLKFEMKRLCCFRSGEGVPRSDLVEGLVRMVREEVVADVENQLRVIRQEAGQFPQSATVDGSQ